MVQESPKDVYTCITKEPKKKGLEKVYKKQCRAEYVHGCGSTFYQLVNIKGEHPTSRIA